MDPTDRQTPPRTAQEPRHDDDGPDDGPEPDPCAQSLTAGLKAAVDFCEQQNQSWKADRIALRCTGAWAEWLGGLSLFVRVPTATVLDQAVTRYAESVGYPAPPPSRLRSNPVGFVTATHQTKADFRGHHEPR